MATAIQTISVPMNVAANTTTLRTFMAEFYDVLTAAGLSQRADTGQADPLTLTYTASTFYHSVWDLNDGGTSIVFRFSWYTTSANTFAKLYVNIGTGTNGAGVLTGPLTEFTAAATPGTTPGVANSGYVEIMGGRNNAAAAAMQFMACRIASEGYFYLELVNQAQDGQMGQGGFFAFWRRKGFEASGHALSCAQYSGNILGTLSGVKPPHTPGTGASYNMQTSPIVTPFYVPWGRTNSEPGKVNFFPFKVCFPSAATYGHDTQRPLCLTYFSEANAGDLLEINIDGDGVRTYRVTDQLYGITSGVAHRLTVLWE